MKFLDGIQSVLLVVGVIRIQIVWSFEEGEIESPEGIDFSTILYESIDNSKAKIERNIWINEIKGVGDDKYRDIEIMGEPNTRVEDIKLYIRCERYDVGFRYYPSGTICEATMFKGGFAGPFSTMNSTLNAEGVTTFGLGAKGYGSFVTEGSLFFLAVVENDRSGVIQCLGLHNTLSTFLYQGSEYNDLNDYVLVIKHEDFVGRRTRPVPGIKCYLIELGIAVQQGISFEDTLNSFSSYSINYQLIGSGRKYSDFKWTMASSSSLHQINNRQVYDDSNVWINEIQAVKNVEIMKSQDGSLDNITLVIYDESGHQVDITDKYYKEQNRNELALFMPILAIDALTYVKGYVLMQDGVIINFLSCDGQMIARDGEAKGYTSFDIGHCVDDYNKSFQLEGTGTTYKDFTWMIGTQTYGEINTAQYIITTTTSPSDKGKEYMKKKANVHN